MKSLITISILFILTSCGGDWYLNEPNKQPTLKSQKKVIWQQHFLNRIEQSHLLVRIRKTLKQKGTGFNLGLTYKSLLIQQKFQYYQNTFDTVTYNYSVNGSPTVEANIDYETSGFSYLLE